MDDKFNSLPWHDAELLEINIDRSDPGNCDTITIRVRWPGGNENNVTFRDCYLLSAKMNFGIISEESILNGECIREDEVIASIKSKWQSLGVDLGGVFCYRITTNSTNSQLDIYALSFLLS